MTTVEAPHNLYQQRFDRVFDPSSNGQPAWLRRVRREAIARFADEGFPTTRDEDWRFTPVARHVERGYDPAGDVLAPAAEAIAPCLLEGVDTIRIVLVNGRLAPGLSRHMADTDRVRIGGLASTAAAASARIEASLGRAIRSPQRGFTALNTAFLEDGAVVLVGRGTRVDRPIEILYFSTGPRPFSAHPRTLIALEEGAEATVIETFAGDAGAVYWTNAVTEAIVGPNARLNHYRVQRESLRAFHLSSTHFLLDRDARSASHNVTLGGGFVRNDINAALDGEGIECTVNGLYLGEGTQFIDNHTAIDHIRPHCESHEVFKGVLDGRSQGVFNGKIFVRQDAQKTDAKQTNQVLLLSDEATINTKPQLEIFADDVKCTHGATVGQLDQDGLFYLRTRGIGAREARALLVHAFAEDIIERIEVAPLRAALDELLLRRLPVPAE